MPDRTEEIGEGNFDFESDFLCDEATGMDAYTFAQKVIDRLRSLGLERSERPRIEEDHVGVLHGLNVGDYFDGRLPTVIRRLSMDQLSSLYSLFSNWFAYLQYQTNIIAAEMSESKRQKEFLFSLIRQQNKIDAETGKKRSDQAMSDAARNDSRFVVANAKFEELHVTYQCMINMVEVAAQDMKVISREVTIQQNKILLGISEKGMASRRPDMMGVRSFHGNQENQPESGTDEGPAVPRKATQPRVWVKR